LPILNGIFIVGFIYLLFQLLSKMFMHSKSPRFVAKQMERFENPEKGRIDKEIRDDRREQKLIKRQTMKITNKEIQSIEDMEKYLEQVIDIVEKNGANLDEHQKSEVVSSLQKIGANEEILRKGMENIIRHLQAYEQHHKKDLNALKQQFDQAQNNKERKELENEIIYQQKMLEALEFMKAHENKITDFCRFFNTLISRAMQSLTEHKVNESLNFLLHAYNDLKKMKSIYEKQKQIEKYILKMDKRLMHDLKKERARAS